MAFKKEKEQKGTPLSGEANVFLAKQAKETQAQKYQEVFERHEKILLSDRDFHRFVEIIENPQPPTLELIKSMREYQKLSLENPNGNW